MNKYEIFINKTTSWLEKYLTKHNIKNVVIGVSGGIDSAVSLCILTKIKELKIHAYFIDINSTPQSLKDAKEICAQNNIDLNVIDLKNVFDSFLKTLGNVSKIQEGNLKVRLRTTYLYDRAFQNNAILIGNTNYDEMFLGYFTKFGDNAADVMLLNNLVKSDVYNLAKYLNIPSSIINKTPSADLYNDQFDEHEIGVKYKIIDKFLLGFKVSTQNEQKIINLNKANKHKSIILSNPYSLSKIKK